MRPRGKRCDTGGSGGRVLDNGCVVGFVSFFAGGGGDFVDGEGCGVGFLGLWGCGLGFFGWGIDFLFRLLGL